MSQPGSYLNNPHTLEPYLYHPWYGRQAAYISILWAFIIIIINESLSWSMINRLNPIFQDYWPWDMHSQTPCWSPQRGGKSGTFLVGTLLASTTTNIGRVKKRIYFYFIRIYSLYILLISFWECLLGSWYFVLSNLWVKLVILSDF